jgi:hypothetical protein
MPSELMFSKKHQLRTRDPRCRGAKSPRRGPAAVLLVVAALSVVLAVDAGRAAIRHAAPSPSSGPSVSILTTRPATTRPAAAASSGEAGKPPTTVVEGLKDCADVLAEVRSILVDRCAPALSRRCYQMIGPDAELADLAREALGLLDRAARMLDDADEAAVGSEGGSVRTAEAAERHERVDVLRAFAEMFAALAADPAADGEKDHLLGACNGLAPYLDDENQKVAASARLWMGVAYRLAGRPERTLQLIRPVLGPPDDARIDLAARLQRCLAMGERGEHVAALAVGLRIGGRVGKWFEDDDGPTRRLARDAVRYTRVELWRSWAERLRAEGDARAADEADRQAKELLDGETWPPPPDRRWNLTVSIAGIEEWE